MKYLIALVVLAALELLYFAIAKKFNIVDRPNERSSHTRVTLLGGGIIFFFSVLYFAFTSHFAYPWFLLGLSLVALVSYIDDICDISSLLRMGVQLMAFLLILYQFHVFDLAPWKIVAVLVIAIGTINIYNFMDGINGMLAAYSLVVLGTFAYINRYVLAFVQMDLILLPMIAIMVFGFFNFRHKARCFSGDVGSIVMGCLVLFLIGRLIQATPTSNAEISYLVFISVYLADGGFTILKRMLRGENILKPHREHLYETLCNEMHVPHLCVSSSYALLQLAINVAYFLVPDRNLYAVCVGIGLMCAYSAVFFFYKQKMERQ